MFKVTQDISKNFRFFSSITNPCTLPTRVQSFFSVKYNNIRAEPRKTIVMIYIYLCINKTVTKLNQELSLHDRFSNLVLMRNTDFFAPIPELTDLKSTKKGFGWRAHSVGDLPHLHWEEADHWSPGCGTESAWTGACPTHWASVPGRHSWSSSSAHWCWHDAWAHPR